MLVACLLLGLLAACTGQSGSLGERIYREGRGEHGSLEVSRGPRWLSRGDFGCATCHGEKGEGRFVSVGTIAASSPPVNRAVLRARGYDRETLRRAIIEGVSVEGRALSDYMPRWQLEAVELNALIDYLENL